MIGQYSLGGPAQQADDPRRRGRRPGRARGAGAGRHPLLRLGHDADLLPADVPRRPAGDRAPPRSSFRSAGRGDGGRLPAVPALPARRGVARRLTHSTGRVPSRAVAATAVDLYTRPTLDQPTMPTRRAHDPPRRAPLVWTAILILYVVWGSTYLGIRIAVETIPPFLMAAIRFADRRARHARRRSRSSAAARSSGPTRRELRDCVHRRGAADGRRHGRGRLGRADRAVGDRRAPDRDDAGLGRGLRPGLLPRAAAASRRPSASRRACSASRSSSARRSRSSGSLDPAGIVALLLSPIAWAGGSRLRGARARAAARPVPHDRAPDARGRARPRRRRVATGELAGFDPAAVTPRVARRARLPDASSAASSRSPPTPGSSATRRCR